MATAMTHANPVPNTVPAYCSRWGCFTGESSGPQPWEGSETDTPPQAQPHVATNWGVTRFGPNTTPIVLPSLILSFYYLQHQGSQTQTLIEGSVEGDKLGRRVGVDGTIGRGGESDQMQNKLSKGADRSLGWTLTGARVGHS